MFRAMGVVGSIIVAVVAIVALSFALLFWSGALRIQETQIQRGITVNSVQYITSINTSLLNYKSDYAATADPSRQKSIIDQFCNEAAKIQPDQIAASAQAFYLAHCK